MEFEVYATIRQGGLAWQGTEGVTPISQDSSITAPQVGPGVGGANGFSFDASVVNSTYGNADTVQQEQIQYPYFIQVATGCDESIDTTRATEINNPFFFI